MSDIVERLEDWLAPSNALRDSTQYALALDARAEITQLRRQRNAQTFALQCFHSHAVKNGDNETAATIHDYLTAAGIGLHPDHSLIAPLTVDPQVTP